MQGELFRCEEFGLSAPGRATLIFICPYSASIELVRFSLRRLLRAGYHIVAYQTNDAVFTDADPAILPELIAAVRGDIRLRIAKLKSAGVTELGFFGSSLGSFIFYNCVGDQVPELRWGVFNTGGDIAKGMWRLEGARQAFVRRGLATLAGWIWPGRWCW